MRPIKLLFILMILSALTLSSCASYMHGYTQRDALDKYLLVDKSSENFGYKRIQYNLGFNGSLEGFINSQGLPDFIYEYMNNKGRDSIRMYYTQKNIVYIYESNSWLADSLYLKDHRPLTEYEIAKYKELIKDKS